MAWPPCLVVQLVMALAVFYFSVLGLVVQKVDNSVNIINYVFNRLGSFFVHNNIIDFVVICLVDGVNHPLNDWQLVLYILCEDSGGLV